MCPSTATTLRPHIPLLVSVVALVISLPTVGLAGPVTSTGPVFHFIKAPFNGTVYQQGGVSSKTSCGRTNGSISSAANFSRSNGLASAGGFVNATGCPTASATTYVVLSAQMGLARLNFTDPVKGRHEFAAKWNISFGVLLNASVGSNTTYPNQATALFKFVEYTRLTCSNGQGGIIQGYQATRTISSSSFTLNVTNISVKGHHSLLSTLGKCYFVALVGIYIQLSVSGSTSHASASFDFGRIAPACKLKSIIYT